MDGTTTQAETGTQVQTPAAAASAEQQSAEVKTTLEEFLADETNKAAYETAISDAVAAALEKQKADAEEEERLAKLSKAERLELREKEIAAKEEKLAAAERKNAAITALADAKIPTKLADCLDYSSKESYESSLATAMAAFQEAVETGINERLRGKGQVAAGAASVQALTGNATTDSAFAELLRSNQVKR